MKVRCSWLPALALLLPAVAGAQTMRGVVVDRGDIPVPGVVMLLLDDASLVTARSLSNERGEFRLAAPRPGGYRVRTMRIGYQPVVSDVIALSAGADVVKRLVLTGVAFSLDTVRVVSQNSCRAVADSGAATFAVWDQVRTALTATQLTASARATAVTTLTYQRALDPGNKRVRRQTAAIRTGYVSQPWLSLTPEMFHQTGYVVTDASAATTYYAPGLDVLLSNTFIEDHCFRLTSDKARLGIEFEPTRERRRIPEIKGTIWLDRTSSELRGLEMSYVNIETDQERNAGSEMEFVRMANGTWAISRWSIRMPVMEQRLRSGSLGGSAIYVSEVKVEGGELVMARVGKDTVWAQPPRILLGTVMDSVSGAPIAGAKVSLDGTTLRDSTDARGTFRLAGVLPGEYTIVVRTPSLDSASAQHQSTLSFTDASAMHQLRVPTAQQIASSICSSRTEFNGIVMGSVGMREGGLVPRDAKVRVEWDALTLRNGGGSIATSRTVRQLETTVDSRGVFRVCGVPTDANLMVHAESDSAIADPLALKIPTSGRFARADVVFDRLAAGLATFTGVVLADSTRQPLADVEVRLPALSKSTVTNERGTFRIIGIPPGEQQVLVRRIGYGPADAKVTFLAGKTLEKQVILRRAVVLDTVATVGRAPLASFEEHRKLGLGHFFTREQIKPMEGMHLSSILGDVQGLGIAHGNGNVAYILPKRPRIHGCNETDYRCLREKNVTRPANGGPLACYSQVYIDEMLINPGRPTDPFDLNSVPPNTIEALEYYSLALQAPHKYNNANADCGVLVIWTRRVR
jgi:hypothetical protein